MIREAASGRPPSGRGIVLLALVVAAASAAAEGPRPAAEGLAGRLTASVAEAQRLVEKVRGVPFRGPVASAVLPERDLPRILEKKLAEDLPVSFERYAASLVALGLVAPEPDLKSRMLKLYARQVAGFYDPEEKKFFVVPERSDEVARSAAGFGASADRLLEEALLTHELTHALQDRRLDLVPRMKALRENSDASLALQAFLEGEATVVMMEALLSRLPPESRSLTSTDQLLASMAELAAGGLAGAEGVPEYFVEELLFPYTAGTAWVAGRRAEGGWAAVDAGYDHPPETTAEILDPARFRAPRALLPFAALPSSEDLPPRARLLYADRLGAFTVKALLETAGAGGAAGLAASWQDDRILFYEMPGRASSSVGFVWSLRPPSAEAARTLAASLAAFYDATARGEAAVRVDGDVVRVARRPAVPRPARPARAAPLTPSAGASGPRAGR
ncbi:MAG TPA: hypothetical protein PK598_02945 [Thermoanaerobaculia bacterium]|nr:hypothetical protein [Thermoanaerobaculia bacterium]